ncbi:hypothetical protein ADIARSV_1509 [Arcticibacter svalbardensis MN12-7]|uniref:Uncharacterized protein n=2 Tax=Arcticibacter TaxID=1288026 RepID=R9H278_9SPHI|nr:hypothetical protein ADIARSV_1509 [Arcticibacter svalbardensis MN12-7]
MIITSFISCKKTQDQVEKEQLINAINQTQINENYRWIVVLPGLGCHGCIQEGEAFMRDHIKDNDILFVLTKISSLKILQQKIGMKITEQANVYIDKKDIFSISTDNGIYPCIIKMEEGKVSTHEFQSPKNGSAFAKLNSLIAVK